LDVPAQAPVLPSPDGHFAARSDNLASTLKWLVASAGAIAVAIVAGLQLTTLKDLQPWAAILATAGAVSALVAVGLVLFGAARVLAVDVPTVIELSNAEIDANATSGGDLVAQDSLEAQPPLLRWLYERRTSLLGDATSITSLYTDGIVGTGRALESLRRNQRYKWGQRDLLPDSASDIAWLDAERAVASSRIERLEAAAGYWQRRDAYQRLIKKIPWTSGLFLAGIFTFSLAPVWGPADPPSDVKNPVPARIYVQDASTAGVPPSCPAILSGQIVGGSLERPIVVTTPNGPCPALKLAAQDEALIVVPDPTVSSGVSQP
jgi:hypothetical protein